MTKKEKQAAKIFAAIGGRCKSKKKTLAARRNGLKGGRPRNKLAR